MAICGCCGPINLRNVSRESFGVLGDTRRLQRHLRESNDCLRGFQNVPRTSVAHQGVSGILGRLRGGGGSGEVPEGLRSVSSGLRGGSIGLREPSKYLRGFQRPQRGFKVFQGKF